jgi:hypothetical protein
MAPVMLIQSNLRLDRAVIRRAIEEAGNADDSLVVLAVLDPAIPEKVATQFAESGDIGRRPSEGFLSSPYERHEELALWQADEIIQDGREAGVAVEAAVRRGDYARETADAIRRIRPATVVIEKKRRSLLRSATGDEFIHRLRHTEGFNLVEV